MKQLTFRIHRNRIECDKYLYFINLFCFIPSFTSRTFTLEKEKKTKQKKETKTKKRRSRR
jgi:hypothetical protein